MKRWLALGAMMALTACAQPAPPVTPASGPPAPAAATASPAVGPAKPAATVAPTLVANAAAQAHLEAARTALKANDMATSLKEAEAATKADPQSSDTFYVLGNVNNQAASLEADVQKRVEALQRAQQAYNKAIELNPKNDAAYVNLGTVYYQNGQFDEAQKQVEYALSLNPQDATGHYILGTIHLQADPAQKPDAIDKAKQAFDAAVKLDPNFAVAYTGLATVFLFKNDFANAQKSAQRALDLMKDTRDPYVFWALAQAQCLGGDKAGGSKTLEKILSLNPPDARFRARVRELSDTCK